MTKQEEIMRTPEQKEAHKVYRASLRREKIRDETNKLMDRCWTKGSYPGQMVFQRQKFLNELLPLLDGLGVVIRVDREIPFHCRGCTVTLEWLACYEPLIHCSSCKKEPCTCPSINRGSFAKYVEEGL